MAADHRSTTPAPNETEQEALLELARFIARVAVQDYLSELARAQHEDDAATVGEHRPEVRMGG